MFAYCGNNPVSFYDETGYAVTPIRDKIVHDYVLGIICSQNSDLSYKETCIYYNKLDWTGGWGFCDLYNKETGEVWELKKNSNLGSCSTSRARRQLNKYINGRLKNNLNLPLTLPNETSIGEGRMSFSFDQGIYDYYGTYWYEGEGIIRYEYSCEVKEECRVAVGVATVAIALIATILRLAGVPVPNLAPAYIHL